MIYQWKQNSRIPVSAQIAGERLEAIRDAHGGRLQPEMVVEDARDVHSPLHPAFEWDDVIAAEKYRVEQAGHIIRCVVVVTEDQSAPPTRAFVSVVQGGDDDSSYTHIIAAMADDNLRAQVLARARAELEQWHKKYRDLQEFAAVTTAIESVIA